jgi:hypothetical protein
MQSKFDGPASKSSRSRSADSFSLALIFLEAPRELIVHANYSDKFT